MRTALLACLLLGCPAPQVVPTATSDGTDSPSIEPIVEKQAKAPVVPFVPHAAPVPVQSVAIVGYGLRIDVNPPFQAAFMGVYVEDDNKEGLIVSWWDVTHAKSGRTGHAGLYNLGVAVHANKPGDTVIKTTLPWPDGKLGTAYRLGESGSYVLLPPELSELGGIGTVSAGPSDKSWAIEVQGKRTPFAEGVMLHSNDPETGALFALERDPRKPWGPWPK